MKKQHSIRVCGADELHEFCNAGITHLITIANPGVVRRPPDWFSGDHLALSFGDVVSEHDACLYKTTAASSDDIKQALLFFRAACRRGPCSLLVSCDYGASRSPAVAYVLLADICGPGGEKQAFDRLLACRSVAVPNQLVVSIGDRQLGRKGALLGPLRDYYRYLLSTPDDSDPTTPVRAKRQ